MKLYVILVECISAVVSLEDVYRASLTWDNSNHLYIYFTKEVDAFFLFWGKKRNSPRSCFSAHLFVEQGPQKMCTKGWMSGCAAGFNRDCRIAHWTNLWMHVEKAAWTPCRAHTELKTNKNHPVKESWPRKATDSDKHDIGLCGTMQPAI